MTRTTLEEKLYELVGLGGAQILHEDGRHSDAINTVMTEILDEHRDLTEKCERTTYLIEDVLEALVDVLNVRCDGHSVEARNLLIQAQASMKNYRRIFARGLRVTIEAPGFGFS